MMNLKTLKTGAGVIALLCLAAPAFAATSVSQFGITWTFDRDYPAGQFANGDWWVVGPVRITNITPSDTDGVEPHMHGSMINPAASSGGTVHGFDSRIRRNTYNHGLNVARSFPLVVPNGSSLLSAKSVLQYLGGDTGDGQQLEVVAILTVLSSAPPAGSFRPPYMGTDKTIRWNKSNIDYSKLRSLAPVAGTPSLATVEGRYEKTLIQFGTSWQAGDLHPHYNLPFPGKGYGREIAQGASEAALSLNLNYSNAQKERLAIRVIQWGIDIYGAVTNGMSYPGDGGHNHGRKLPMFLAGVLLNDASITDRANGTKYRNSFAEDQQHFYVSRTDIDTPRTAPCCGRAYEPYTQSMLGMPEWGPNQVTSPTNSYSQWSASYRTVVGSDLTGTALAVHLMGLESVWNWPAFFDYYDRRYYPTESPNARDASNYIKVYVKNMWTAYRNSSPPPPAQTQVPATPQNLRIGSE